MKALRFLTGWFPVATKEGRATILSPRLLIVAAILALAVLAGTYAISPGLGGGGGAPSRVVYDFTYFPDLNGSKPAMALFLAGPTGDPLSGVEIDLVNITGPFEPFEPEVLPEVLETKLTDASGWARFEGLLEQYPNRELALQMADEPGSFYAFVFPHNESFPSPPLENQGVMANRLFTLGGNADQRILSLVFVDTRGVPQEGADVFIWEMSPEERFGGPFEEITPPEGWDPYRNGTTDANGYYLRPEPLGSGRYALRVSKGELNATSRFSFSGDGGLPSGPDGALAFSGLLFVPLILPIMALVLAYDAIARERSEGSLDLLLSKPVGRIGVALGKLAGVFGSMAIPVVAIILAAAAIIWVRTGLPPSGSFLASFLGEVLLLLFLYTLVFLAISSNVRNLGTALLVSILLFLLFVFFWGLISFMVASLFASPGSVRFFEIVMTMSLATPSGVYQQLLSLSVGSLLGGLFGPIGGAAQQVPLFWIASAAVLWTILPLVLFLLAMKYRVTEA